MTIDDRIPVWLDCDTGNDDAFAILLLACHPKFNLVGISTCYGNAPLSKTTRNTLAILEILGFKQNDILVYAGASKPLAGKAHYALDVHGDNGIEGLDIPNKLSMTEVKDAFFFEALKKESEKWKGELCMVCSGSLTNLAAFIVEFPEARNNFKFISIMGGAFDGLHNITPYSEFNVHCDPKASSVVFEDTILKSKIILAPLNLTHKAIVTKDIQDRIFNIDRENLNSEVRRIYYNICTEFGKTYAKNEEFVNGPPVHDPMAVFILYALIQKEKGANDFNLEYKRGQIEVIRSGTKIGSTILHETEGSNSYIAFNVDVEKFWEFIFKSFEIADGRTS